MRVTRQLLRLIQHHIRRKFICTPSAPVQPQIISPLTLRRVLICRINHRLGNMLFLTPLIQALAQRAPNCEIDLLIGDTFHAQLFQGLARVKQVFDFRAELLIHPLRLVRWLYRFRKVHYDLVIAPSPTSTSDHIATLCAKSCYRLGFAVPTHWCALTHTAPPAHWSVPEALKPLQLLRLILPRAEYKIGLDIGLSRGELDAGRVRLATALGCGRRRPDTPVAGFFIDARGDKRLSATWWRCLCRDLQSHGVRLVQILPPAEVVPLESTIPVYRSSDLRRLGTILSQMDLFVSADTGVMHLASAVQVPTVGLFKASAMHLYRPFGPRDLALDVRTMPPMDVAAVVRGHLSLSKLAC